MNPRTLLRTAALNALAAAALLEDPDFAPLKGAQVFLGQTWPSQSPAPGALPLPNQLLIYGWDDESETVSGKTSASQFATTGTVVIEARFETKAPATSGTLGYGSMPDAQDISGVVDGQLDGLIFAVKKAVCQGVQIHAMALNGGMPAIDGIKSVKSTSKYALEGQRIAANAAVSFDLDYTETFEPLIPNALNDLRILINPQAGGLANPGNAGNGPIGSVTVGLGAMPGAYAVLFTAPTSFAVTMPDASAAGAGTVGTLFAGGGLTFTIGAGSHAFISGDGFTVTVMVAAENLLDLSS